MSASSRITLVLSRLLSKIWCIVCNANGKSLWSLDKCTSLNPHSVNSLLFEFFEKNFKAVCKAPGLFVSSAFASNAVASQFQSSSLVRFIRHDSTYVVASSVRPSNRFKSQRSFCSRGCLFRFSFKLRSTGFSDVVISSMLEITCCSGSVCIDWYSWYNIVIALYRNLYIIGSIASASESSATT